MENDVLVVGAGPAGMECAMVLGKRGMRRVHLVDDQPEPGGHLRWVTTLPGLGTWSRVTQYRQAQITKLKNVELIPKTRLETDDVLEYGAEIVVIATGSEWDGFGLNGPTHTPIDGVEPDADHVLTPEQLVLDGKSAGERVVVYDTDGYYMGATMAERLAADDKAVTYVTPFDSMAPYMRFTLEEQRQYQRLVELGVDIVPQTLVLAAEPGRAQLLQHFSGNEREIEIDSIMVVTQRNSRSALYDELKADPAALEEAGISGVYCIGDAWAPGMIAQSVFSGHRLAREIDSEDPSTPLPFIRERRLVDSVEDDYALGAATLQIAGGLAVD
jgi:dimethylamine/trimethylamine dehydrogenase